MLYVIIFIALIVIGGWLLGRGRSFDAVDLRYGVTFSKKQAVALGLDWRAAYTALLDELGVRRIRIPAYWDETEPKEGEFVWTDIDWQLDEAAKRGAQVILVVGGRQPRWPECHFPKWAQALTLSDRQAKTLDHISATILRYNGRNEIAAWQVENEPFLPNFGECQALDLGFLEKELALVKSLDDRPVVVTDSGELSFWIGAARRADIFGTSLYRDTYSAHLQRYIHYPIGPGFFRAKRRLTSLFASPKEWVVIELQAEPWAPKPFQEISKKERDRTMSLVKFKEIIEFARLTGFREFYLWGVEWWYWEREVNGDASLWEYAGTLFDERQL